MVRRTPVLCRFRFLCVDNSTHDQDPYGLGLTSSTGQRCSFRHRYYRIQILGSKREQEAGKGWRSSRFDQAIRCHRAADPAGMEVRGILAVFTNVITKSKGGIFLVDWFEAVHFKCYRDPADHSSCLMHRSHALILSRKARDAMDTWLRTAHRR